MNALTNAVAEAGPSGLPPSRPASRLREPRAPSPGRGVPVPQSVGQDGLTAAPGKWPDWPWNLHSPRARARSSTVYLAARRQVRRLRRVRHGELTRLRVRPGWGAMFATLSGRIQPPRGLSRIECLFDRAMRGQTTKRFSGPPENRTCWPRRRPSTPKVTTLREIETVKPSPPYPRACHVRKESNF